MKGGNTMKDNIRKFRKKYNLSQNELGERLGVSGKTVSSWELGNSEPKMGMIENLANIFNISKSDLLDNELTYTTPHIDIPLYSEISCGTASFVAEDIEEYITMPLSILKDDVEYFANYASGDSMIDINIKDGDLLIFKTTNYIDTNDIGAFCINGEFTCKRYKEVNGTVMLMPCNLEYDPLLIKEDDDFRVIGKLHFRVEKMKGK